jgi:hypothetical protein
MPALNKKNTITLQIALSTGLLSLCYLLNATSAPWFIAVLLASFVSVNLLLWLPKATIFVVSVGLPSIMIALALPLLTSASWLTALLFALLFVINSAIWLPKFVSSARLQQNAINALSLRLSQHHAC